MKWALYSGWPVKSCPKMISIKKLNISTHLQNLPKNLGFLGKIIVAKGFEKLPKVQSGQSDYTTIAY